MNISEILKIDTRQTLHVKDFCIGQYLFRIVSIYIFLNKRSCRDTKTARHQNDHTESDGRHYGEWLIIFNQELIEFPVYRRTAHVSYALILAISC